MLNHKEKTRRNYLDFEEIETIRNALTCYAHFNPISPDLENVKKLLKAYPVGNQLFPESPEEDTFEHLDPSLRETLKKALQEYCDFKTIPDSKNAYWLLHELERLEKT